MTNSQKYTLRRIKAGEHAIYRDRDRVGTVKLGGIPERWMIYALGADSSVDRCNTLGAVLRYLDVYGIRSAS